MPRKRLTLADLVERGSFDPGNHRHRRALDESGPLDNPELEAAREDALYFRTSRAGKFQAAQALQRFAWAVEGRRFTSSQR
jgi:hypothetical protein